MNTQRRFIRAGLPVSAVVLALLGVAQGLSAADAGSVPQPAAAAAATTEMAVAAAQAFLATLSEQERGRVVYRFDDEQQRARWSNFPAGFYRRGGLSLQEMNEAQRAATMALLAAVLSPRGYEKVQQIRDADEAFKASIGARDKQLFGKDDYFISLLGSPSVSSPWMLQFGGHHLALNLTFDGARGVLTPSLTGVQPASFVQDGKTIRPLARENDQGFALVQALDAGQRAQAVLTYQINDLVLGPGHDGEVIPPEGLKVSAMTEAQRAVLLDLITEWVGIADDGHAGARLAEIKAGLGETWFAWSGPTAVAPGTNGASYYRIQGPRLLIEYAPQRGADHVHTMYRDPTGDYGRAGGTRAKPE